jgi:hypothetical protein
MRDAGARSDGSPQDLSGLPQVDELGIGARLRKGTMPGSLLTALYRKRRVPAIARASARAAKAEPPRPGRGPTKVKCDAVYVIPAGPNDWDPLRDTLASVFAYEGAGARVIVIDDASTSCRAEVVNAEFPEVDVVHRRLPTGGPPRNLPTMLTGLRHAHRHYDFKTLIKIDTDALVTGASPSAAAADLFHRHPEVGMAGTYLMRSDGVREDYSFDRWVLPPTERWSRAAKRMMDRARAGGYDGTKVHGGVYAMARPALDAMAASGDLDWVDPWWSQLGEDFWLSILVLANGFALGSLGGPGEAFSVASKYTPIAKELVVSESKLAIHSVRRGADGESEDELREFFRRRRQSATPGAVAADGA